MSVVAIIGAGDLGGALASKLAERDRIREVRLIDQAPGVAAGKALDIQQAGPVEESATRLSASGDLAAAAGANVIVLADSVGPPVTEIQGEAGLALLQRLLRPQAASASGSTSAPSIVCAGASQAWLIAHAVSELGVPAASIVGSAPLALVSALRALIALELNGSAQDVAISLAGQPPQHLAVAWQTASFHGDSLEQLLDVPTMRRIESRVRYLWPPGPYALAAAAARVVEALIAGTHRTLCGFVAEAPAAVSASRSASVSVSARPIRIESSRSTGHGDRWQVRALDLPALTPQQRVALDAIL